MLTVQEAAQEAGITETAIRNAIYRGKLAVVHKYGRMLIERPVFDAYRRNARRGRPRKESAGGAAQA